jgi:hypothetical protein
MIDDETLFVHLLVIIVFVEIGTFIFFTKIA